MAPLADAIPSRPPAFFQFLREELAPQPGRVGAVARIAGSTVLVVAIAMLYEIPVPAYMAYIVFLASREEAASTLMTSVVAGVAATLAIALSLLFYTLDASEPALRLPLMAVSTFIGMFLTRTMTLGPVAFLVAFILVISQTLIDQFPTLEVLTRFVLWLWVVVLVPITVSTLVELAFGRNPARLARRTGVRLLGALGAALRNGDVGALHRHQAEAVALVELRHRAGMFDPALRSRTAIDTMLIETLAELLTVHRLLPPDTPLAVRRPFAEFCDACATALERGDAPAVSLARPTEATLRLLSSEARPVVCAMADALERLGDGIARRRTVSDAPKAPSAKSMFAPDAFSNPAHARFALKTTIAVMAAYIIYAGLDWPGIRTSITTCFFVALGSLGETVHKLTLRLSGAVIGGFAGGLAIVYVLPAIDDIGQLCLLIAAFSAVCGWVATSSERLSYAGMQMAFAFFLGVLQGYGPATDMTVLRDRVIGILLGNLLISVVFSVLWPTSAFDRAQASLAAALRNLGQLLADDGRPVPGHRLAVVRALGEARRFASIAAFELRMLPARVWSERRGLSLDRLDRLAGAVFVVVEQDKSDACAEAVRAQDAAASAWLSASADRVSMGEPGMAACERMPDISGSLAAVPADVPPAQRASIEARVLLQSEIGNACAH